MNFSNMTAHEILDIMQKRSGASNKFTEAVERAIFENIVRENPEFSAGELAESLANSVHELGGEMGVQLETAKQFVEFPRYFASNVADDVIGAGFPFSYYRLENDGFPVLRTSTCELYNPEYFGSRVEVSATHGTEGKKQARRAAEAFRRDLLNWDFCRNNWEALDSEVMASIKEHVGEFDKAAELYTAAMVHQTAMTLAVIRENEELDDLLTQFGL